MPEIVSLGEPLLEFNAAGEGPLATVSSFEPGFGGDTSNFAVAAARLGGDAGYVTRVGDDDFGTALLQMWQREGVDTAQVERDPDRPTGIYFISRGEHGHSFTYYRAGSAATALTTERLPRPYLRSARLVHVTGITQAISDSACDAAFAAMHEAREAGALVSYDPNLRLRLWGLDRARAVVLESLAQADLALPNLEEGRLLTGLVEPREVLAALAERARGTVVLKCGADGALVHAAGETTHVGAPAVEVVDASGAGDTFDAAMAVRVVEGADPVEAARFAAIAGALTTLGKGATGPVPTRAAVEAALADVPA